MCRKSASESVVILPFQDGLNAPVRAGTKIYEIRRSGAWVRARYSGVDMWLPANFVFRSVKKDQDKMWVKQDFPGVDRPGVDKSQMLSVELGEAVVIMEESDTGWAFCCVTGTWPIKSGWVPKSILMTFDEARVRFFGTDGEVPLGSFEIDGEI